MGVYTVQAQELVPERNRTYRVMDGVLTEVKADTTGGTTSRLESTSAIQATADSLHRRRRSAEDTTFVRYSRLFRDTIPISRMTLISVAVPGFAQVYNKQAWKVPVLYGIAGTSFYFYIQHNRKFQHYRRQVDDLRRQSATQEELDPVLGPMITHNSYRTLFFVGALATHAYFVCDGVLNYNGPVDPIKRATTLSTVLPGAGQLYNRSYWKVPIVVGAFATMAYVIDWNQRGYKRYKLAYELSVAKNPAEEFQGYPDTYLRTLRNNYRRNRDLSIIITGGLYLLNIIDAHVDAHMKDFDVSDDLTMTLEPTLINYYTMRARNVNGIGLSFKITF